MNDMSSPENPIVFWAPEAPVRKSAPNPEDGYFPYEKALANAFGISPKAVRIIEKVGGSVVGVGAALANSSPVEAKPIDIVNDFSKSGLVENVPAMASHADVPESAFHIKTMASESSALKEQGPTPTPETTATSTPPPESWKPGTGGAYSEEQQKYLESAEAVQERNWLEAWHTYWATANEKERPVYPVKPGSTTSNMNIELTQDILNSSKGLQNFESPDYKDVVVLPPVSSWENHALPPKADVGHSIGKGEGLTFLSKVSTEAIFKETGIPVGSTLASRDGKYVYMDKEGCVIGKVDNETGKWELAMRIDKEGYLHLENHILRPHSTKQYTEGERTYRSPIIGGYDYKYTEELKVLTKGSRYFEVTYEALNGSKGLEDYWNPDGGFHSSLTDVTSEDALTGKWRILSTVDDPKYPVTGNNFISFISGVPGRVTGIDITKNGVKMVVYDEEDMKYLAPPVAQ